MLKSRDSSVRNPRILLWIGILVVRSALPSKQSPFLFDQPSEKSKFVDRPSFGRTLWRNPSPSPGNITTLADFTRARIPNVAVFGSRDALPTRSMLPISTRVPDLPPISQASPLSPSFVAAKLASNRVAFAAESNTIPLRPTAKAPTSAVKLTSTFQSPKTPECDNSPNGTITRPGRPLVRGDRHMVMPKPVSPIPTSF